MYTRLRIQRELQDDQDRRMAHTRLQQNTILAEQALPTLSRRHNSGSLDPQMILHLQRQLGNKAVCRMLASRKATKTGARSIERTIQRDDDDPDEYEAMPAPNDVASTDNVPDDSYSSGGGDNSASVDDDGGNNYSVGDGNYAQSQSNGDDAYTSDDDDNGDYSEHVDNPGFSNSPEPDEAGETQETISIPDFQSEGSAVVTARGRIDRYIDDYGNDCDKYTGNKCSLQGLTTANFHWTKKAHDIIVEPAPDGGYNAFGAVDLDYTVETTIAPMPVPKHQCMTDCEQGKCQKAIDTILTPHEQQHVAAFKTFEGQERFSDFFLYYADQPAEATVKADVEANGEQHARDRQNSVQAKSNAIDGPTGKFVIQPNVKC